MPQLPITGFCIALAVFLGPSLAAGDESASFDTVGAQYERDVQPLLKQFCLECHSTEQKEGELDLERFGSIAQVRGDLEAWRKVIEMLEEGEMPPEDEPQLSDIQRQRLIRWTRAFVEAEIRTSAGDPGHVVLRRLSNAEYNRGAQLARCRFGLRT